MTLPLLASLEDLAEARGQQFDPTDRKAIRALEDASGLFRALSAQTITRVDDDVAILRGTTDNDLWLPERPVLGVSTIEIAYPGSTEFLDIAGGYTWLASAAVCRYGGWGGERTAVRVTYSHGYDEVPAEIVGAVCSTAIQRLANPGSAVSERMGEHEVVWTAGTLEAAGVSADVLRVARRFKPLR